MKKQLLLTLLVLIGICRNIAAQNVEVYPQLGHSSIVTSVAFSPDGKQIISGSNDNTVKLWDVATGRIIRTLSGHTHYVFSVAFSPDGRQILSGSWDNTIKLWDTATGREIRTFSGHTDGVRSVTFSPDGRQIISGSNDFTIKLWDTVTGREIRSLSGHTNNVSSVAFSPDGKQIISGSSDRTVKLWDMATGQEVRTFSGHIEEVSSVTFSPDGRQILSGSDDSTVKLWDTASGREIRTFSGHTSVVKSVAFSSDGRQIISGSSGDDSTVKLWDTATGREIRTFSDYMVSSVAFSPDSRQILSGGDITVKLRDIATGHEIRTFSGHIWVTNSVAFSPDGRQILSSLNSEGTGGIMLWDAVTGRELRVFFGEDSSFVNFVTFNPDGRQIIYGSDKTIKLWDTATGREIRNFLGHTWIVPSVIFSPDGMQILSCSLDGTVKLWDASTGREIRTFGHTSYVLSVAFSPDGRQILSGSNDNTVKLWDVATGREIRTFSGHTSSVLSVTFSRDGRQIISGSSDKTIKLWDTATGRELRTFSGHTSEVMSVAFSPDGRQVISGSSDKTIKLWDTATGRELRTFSGHTNDVPSVTFSPNGKNILSGGTFDGTIRLWDIATGKEIAQFISFIDGEWIVITPDGYYNSSPNGDSYLNVRVGNNVYGIDQYRSTFYNPQIVEARLQGRLDPVNVTQTIQTAAAPPTVTINSPKNGTNVTTAQTELSVSAVDATQAIRSIQVLVNGRLVGGDSLRGVRGIRGGDLEPTGIRLNENQKRVDFRLAVTLDPGNNRIEVLARNSVSEGRASVEVTYTVSASAQNRLPNLWILAIGANRYDAPQLDDLNYAVADVKAIVDFFKTQEGRRYGKVNSLLIADGERITPTRDNISDNLSYLRQAGPQDVILLFIAGHGLSDNSGEFYFMPSDAAYNTDGSIRVSKAISHREIQSVLAWQGTKLVFIDACQSANTSSGLTQRVNNDRLINSLNSDSSVRASSVIFTSSKGDQGSIESDKYGHGLFTYAILQGLKGEAFPENGTITATALELYVRRKVSEMTEGRQEPRAYRADGLDDFVMARIGGGR